ncbi:MAG: hypothetical protein AAGA57_01915 [Planctomycetota bacterium]
MNQRQLVNPLHARSRRAPSPASRDALPWAPASATLRAPRAPRLSAGHANEHPRLGALLRDCAAGFYQQMYFLGRDVEHWQGNQLKRFGFIRTPCRGLGGTSCYALETATYTIELHGSCACCYARASSVAFIRIRSRFYHWRADHRLAPGLWNEDDLQAPSPSKLLQSLKPLLRWWLDYERWIAQQHGPAYRDECFEEWRKVNKRKAWLPPADAPRWVERFLELGAAHARPKHFPTAQTAW